MNELATLHPTPWFAFLNMVADSKNTVIFETSTKAETAGAPQRVVECVNAMDQIHEPIEFMDCMLDTLQKIKTMMDGTISQNLREAIYDDVCATIDDLQRNKNLPCNK